MIPYVCESQLLKNFAELPLSCISFLKFEYFSKSKNLYDQTWGQDHKLWVSTTFHVWAFRILFILMYEIMKY